MNAQESTSETKEGIAGEKDPVVFFKGSEVQQSEELFEFLKKTLTWTPLNSLCVDCKQNNSTHCLIWLGAFVCKPCSMKHSNLHQFSKSKCYIKEVYKEHWDDYQLRSI